MLEQFPFILSNAIQIAIIATCLYYVLRYLRGTRGAQILLGLASVILSLWTVTYLLNLDVLQYILQAVSMSLVLGLVIVFHPELRRALATLGKRSYRRLAEGDAAEAESPIEILVEAATLLAARRIGALIAIERGDSLSRYEECGGVRVDGMLSAELLHAIFTPPGALHDGGVIVKGKRILAAHCLFPLENDMRLAGAGTRHRAALGLAKESDALVIVVSEERGAVSIAHDDVIRRNVDTRTLERFLRAAFVPKEKEQKTDRMRLIFGTRRESKRKRVWAFLNEFLKVKDSDE